jgi:hypothetical protein
MYLASYKDIKINTAGIAAEVTALKELNVGPYVNQILAGLLQKCVITEVA